MARPPSTADQVFAAWLASSCTAPFASILLAHPEFERELRAFHAHWIEIEPLLRLAGVDPGVSFTERLKAAHGDGVDPEISLDPPESGHATSELLRRLGKKRTSSRYRLEGEVARGGMGAILRVWDEDIRRHLAMKVVLGKGSGETGETPAVDSKFLARFLEEAQVTGQLDHPGIVPVHELGLDQEGRVFFTMKLVKGRDLKSIFDLVFEGGEGWNETRALSVMLKVCEAMAYAHTKGVIHRDLKPANVMVGSFGEVYVMDWGLARVLSRKDTRDIRIKPDSRSALTSVKTERREEREEAPDSPLVTMDGDVMGTPAYMPPEQARGEIDKLSARSDVYALGAMLYHLLSRHVPFVNPGERISNRTVLARVLDGAPKPMTSLRAGIPAELVAIVEKAMSRDPSLRYVDTLALADDLRAYMEQRVVAAYETGTWAEARKWVRRNKPLAASLATVVVALTAGLVVSLTLKREADVNALLALTNEQEAKLNAQRALTGESQATEQRMLAELQSDRAKEAEFTALRDRDHALQQSYVANLVAARAALAAGEVAEGRRRLEACPPQLRGWEWGFLKMKLDPSDIRARITDEQDLSVVIPARSAPRMLVRTIKGPMRVVDSRTLKVVGEITLKSNLETRPDISVDGSRVWSVTKNKADLWDVDAAAEVMHAEAPVASCFLSDGKTLRLLRKDGQVVDLDSRTGAELGRVNSIVATRLNQDADPTFSPDGRRLLYVEAKAASESKNRVVHVLDVQSGVEIASHPMQGETGFVSYRFSPDGRRVCSPSTEKIPVLDLETGAAISVLEAKFLLTREFDATGHLIAATTLEGNILIFDADTGRMLHELPVGREGFTMALAFHPKSSLLAAGIPGGTIRLWDPATGDRVCEWLGNESATMSLFYDREGTALLSGSNDGIIRRFRAEPPLVPTGLDLRDIQGENSQLRTVACDVDGEAIVQVLNDGSVRLTNATSGRTLNSVAGQFDLSIWSRPHIRLDLDRILVTASPDAEPSLNLNLLCRAHDGSVVATFGEHGSFQLATAFDAKGSRFACGFADGDVELRRTSDGSLLETLHGHSGYVMALAFDPKGEYLVSGGLDGRVCFWSTSTWELESVVNLGKSGVESLVCSPDGCEFAVGTGDGTIAIFTPPNSQVVSSWKAHKAGVTLLQYSPSGSSILSSSWDRTMKLWPGARGNVAVDMRGHEGSVPAFAFNPDGTRIASWPDPVRFTGTDPSIPIDTTIRIWDAVSGDALAVLRIDEVDEKKRWSPGPVAWSPDGRRLVSAGMQGGILVWDSEPGMAHPIWEAREARREAAPLVARTFVREASREETMRVLREQPNLEPRLRSAALELALDLRDLTPLELNDKAWEVVKRADASPQSIELALGRARRLSLLQPGVPVYMNTYGTALYRHGDFEQAIAVLEEGDRLNQSRPVVEQYSRANDLLFIAMAHEKLGRHETRSRLLEEADRLIGGSTDLELRGFQEEAHRLAVANCRSTLGEDHPDTLSAKYQLALVLFAHNTLPEAETWCRQVMDIRQARLGTGHPETLASMDTLASILQARAKRSEAEILYRQALEGRRTLLGDDHVDTLSSMRGLASVLRAQGKLDEAEPLYRSTLVKARAALGAEHILVLRTELGLGALLTTRGSFAEAEPLLVHATSKVRSLTSVEGVGAFAAAKPALRELYRAWHAADPTAGHDKQAAALEAELGLK